MTLKISYRTQENMVLLFWAYPNNPYSSCKILSLCQQIPKITQTRAKVIRIAKRKQQGRGDGWGGAVVSIHSALYIVLYI